MSLIVQRKACLKKSLSSTEAGNCQQGRILMRVGKKLMCVALFRYDKTDLDFKRNVQEEACVWSDKSRPSVSLFNKNIHRLFSLGSFY